MRESGSEVRGVVIAAIAGIAVNVLSSFFDGDFALLMLLLCVAVLVAVFWRRGSAQSGNARDLDRRRWIGSARFWAIAFLIGAGLGWLAILPIFPAQLFKIPGIDRIDLGAFFWLQDLGIHGYELLAGAFIAVMALVAIIRGQHFLIVAQFVLAAAAGIVVVFAAAAPHFAEPVVTYVGVVLGIFLFLALCMALPGAGRVIADFFRLPSTHRNSTVPTSREAKASASDPSSEAGETAPSRE
ncbi:hypothetical protein [Microbacterium sp. NPDC076895]|uniref:hypothetical protein n=1 Tax=Microbacterium sp. NPDC076895 TaxID=3154957 RepID=UPI003444A40C